MFEKDPSGPDVSQSELADYASFLDALPTMFPNLASLYLSVQGEIWFTFNFSLLGLSPESVPRTVMERIVEPVDEMVRQLGPHVRNLAVAIPSSLYACHRSDARAAGDAVEQACRGQQERLWRKLSGSAARSGYWVQLGYRDLSLPYCWDMGRMTVTRAFVHDEDWVLYTF